jgi:hypothetical protein
MYGDWKVYRYRIDNIKQVKSNITVLLSDGRFLPCGFSLTDIKFYDTNGKYTGFRLKSLK